MIDIWEIYKPGRSGAGCSRVQSSLHQNGLTCRSSIFQSIFNFSSEMESGNISLPLITCQSQNSKILKNSITLIYKQCSTVKAQCAYYSLVVHHHETLMRGRPRGTAAADLQDIFFFALALKWLFGSLPDWYNCKPNTYYP